MKSKVVLISLLIIIAASCNQATTNTEKQAETVQAAPAAADSQRMIIAKVSIKPENVEEFINAAQGIIKSSNEEEGCIEYQLFQSPYEKTSFVFVEKYTNQAAVDFHFSQPYFKEFGNTVSGWTQKAAEIKIYDISGERTAE